MDRVANSEFRFNAKSAFILSQTHLKPKFLPDIICTILLAYIYDRIDQHIFKSSARNTREMNISDIQLMQRSNYICGECQLSLTNEQSQRSDHQLYQFLHDFLLHNCTYQQ